MKDWKLHKHPTSLRLNTGPGQWVEIIQSEGEFLINTVCLGSFGTLEEAIHEGERLAERYSKCQDQLS